MRLLVTLLIALLTTPAWAVTYDTTTSDQKSGSGTTLTQAHTVTAGGSNRAIFLACGLDSNTITLTATYAGEAMSEVRRDQHGASGTSTWIFKKLAPATGANNWIVTQSSADNMICYAVSATDVDQTTGTSQDTGSCPASGATSISNAVTSAGDNDLVMDIVGIGNTGHTLVAGADQTERMNLTETTAYESAGSTQLGSISGDAMSWTWTTSETACQSVVAIKHFVSGARPISPIIFQ